mmetsp:Transcript_6156/g.15223  ORF Transcript_6156/g.15223 Transcript_6156/m.15223 type:complete len:87 (+) Transcript_6156:3322-3582(+)
MISLLRVMAGVGKTETVDKFLSFRRQNHSGQKVSRDCACMSPYCTRHSQIHPAFPFSQIFSKMPISVSSSESHCKEMLLPSRLSFD